MIKGEGLVIFSEEVEKFKSAIARLSEEVMWW